MATWSVSKGKWVAKRKRNGVSTHLGYYLFREQAELAEELFDRENPREQPYNRWDDTYKA